MSILLIVVFIFFENHQKVSPEMYFGEFQMSLVHIKNWSTNVSGLKSISILLFFFHVYIPGASMAPAYIHIMYLNGLLGVHRRNSMHKDWVQYCSCNDVGGT